MLLATLKEILLFANNAVNKRSRSEFNIDQLKQTIAQHIQPEILPIIFAQITEIQNTLENHINSLTFTSSANVENNFTIIKTTIKCLLPIIRLIYLVDNNGAFNNGESDRWLIEKYVAKIAILLGSFKNAVKYLDQFVKRKELKLIRQKKNLAPSWDNNLLQESCNFNLPSCLRFLVSYYSDSLAGNLNVPAKPINDFIDLDLPADLSLSELNLLLRKLQYFAKTNMFDPEFLLLIGNMQNIQKYITQRAKEVKEQRSFKLSTQERQKRLLSISSEITLLKRRYDSLKDQKINSSIQLKPEDQEFYANFGKQLNTKLLTYAENSAGISFANADLTQIKAFFAELRKDKSPELYYLLDKGLTSTDHAELIKLTGIDDDLCIPPIKIDGASLGYEGYYLRRLDVATSADAAMAACLGKLSGCCQFLSNTAGEACFIHGLTSPNGGFYVICQGEVTDPNIEDPLLAQVWGWRSTTEAIVIDSIEILARNAGNLQLVQAFFEHLAYKLIVDHKVPKICLGYESGIAADFKIKGFNYQLSEEIPKDYEGKRDSSDEQFLFCAPDLLYLIPGEIQAREFFAYLKTLNLTATDPECLKMLSVALNMDREELLSNYLALFGLPGTEILGNCRTYIDVLNSRKYQDALELLLQNIYLFNLRDQNNENLFKLSLADPNLIEKILEILSKEQLLTTLAEIQFPEADYTILQLAIKHPKTLEKILAYLKKVMDPDLILGELEKHNIDGNNLLHLAASSFGHPDSLQRILALYPADRKLAVIQEKNHSGREVLSCAVTNAASLQQLLVLYPAANSAKSFPEKMSYEKDLLKTVIFLYPEATKEILQCFPENIRLEILKQKISLINIANSELNINIFQLIIDSLDADLIDLNMLSNINFLCNELNMHVENRNFIDKYLLIQQCLEVLSIEDLLQALQIKNSKGNTILELAKFDPKLSRIIEPLGERIDQIDQEKNSPRASILTKFEQDRQQPAFNLTEGAVPSTLQAPKMA